MPTVIDLQALGDAPGTLETVARSLKEGCSVGLPFEWSYGTARLAKWRGSSRSSTPRCVDDAPLNGHSIQSALAFRDVAAVCDACGPVEGRAYRLIRRCWPGPAVVAFSAPSATTPLRRLREPIADALGDGKAVPVTVPRHPFVSELLRHVPGPLLVELPLTKRDVLESATAYVNRHSELIDILVDDGPVRYDQLPTTVLIAGDDWRIVEEGILSARTIQRMAGEMILFVCTGNTCRSPMAEAVFRRLLASRLGCTDDEVADQGFAVASAGLAASRGAPASPEAVVLLEQRGIDLNGHESQQATRELIEKADRVIAMTRAHLEAIVSEMPDVAAKVRVLSSEGRDLIDPIGRGPQEYQDCLEQLSQDLAVLVDELVSNRNEGDEK